MESEDEHEDVYSSHPWLQLYEEQGNQLRLHNVVRKSESADETSSESWLNDPRMYIPLRFFKTIQGFHRVRLLLPTHAQELGSTIGTGITGSHWTSSSRGRYVVSSDMSDGLRCTY
jgi:hypothetical protein